MKKFRRMFVIVMDSVGIGAEPDADKFFNGDHNDVGSNTWVHVAEKKGGLKVETMNALGIHDLAPIEGTTEVKHPHSYVQTLREKSNGKDTLTGHREMMGIMKSKPPVTSADSVLQIAANIDVVPLEELYRDCEIAREITMKKEWRVGRIIARPFVGTEKGHFNRTTDRRDYALEPDGNTALDDLIKNNKEVIAVGKIHDIFAGRGMNESYHIDSNHDGMMKTLDIAKNRDFEGLCFVNLADFDVLYGHRRNPLGYGDSIEEFDKDLKEILAVLKDDDCLMITADHGNDPTWWGTDHTRERVPLITYSPSYQNGRLIPERDTFGCIGKTVLKNFSVTPSENEIGDSIDELLGD